MKNKIDCDIIGIIGQSGLLLGRMAPEKLWKKIQRYKGNINNTKLWLRNSGLRKQLNTQGR